MRFIYPTIVTKLPGGGYQASFPDLEGCVVRSDTLDHVLDEAREAALNWITLELEDAYELPPVSHPEDLTLAEGERIHQISITYRPYDGWDE